MHEAVIRTIASVGARIEGASTSLRRMSNGAWIVVAFTGTTFLLVTGSGDGTAPGGEWTAPPVSDGAHQHRLALVGGLRRRQVTVGRVVLYWLTSSYDISAIGRLRSVFITLERR